MAPANASSRVVGRPKDSLKLYNLKRKYKETKYNMHQSTLDLVEGVKDEYLKSIGLDPEMPKEFHRKLVGLGKEQLIEAVREKQMRKAMQDKQQMRKAMQDKQQMGKKAVRDKQQKGPRKAAIKSKKPKEKQMRFMPPKVLPAERIVRVHQQQMARANPPSGQPNANPIVVPEGKRRIAHTPKIQHIPQEFLVAPSNGIIVLGDEREISPAGSDKENIHDESTENGPMKRKNGKDIGGEGGGNRGHEE